MCQANRIYLFEETRRDFRSAKHSNERITFRGQTRATAVRQGDVEAQSWGNTEVEKVCEKFWGRTDLRIDQVCARPCWD